MTTYSLTFWNLDIFLIQIWTDRFLCQHHTFKFPRDLKSRELITERRGKAVCSKTHKYKPPNNHVYKWYRDILYTNILYT